MRRRLIASDAVDHTRRAIGALRDYAIARGSRPMRAVAAWYDAEVELRIGNVAVAERLATDALELAAEPGEPAPTFAAGPLRVLAGVLAEEGDSSGAHDALDYSLALDRASGTTHSAETTDTTHTGETTDTTDTTDTADTPDTPGFLRARARLHLTDARFERAYAAALADAELAAAYRKLEVSGRAELAACLSAA